MGGGSQQGGGQFPINQRGQTSYPFGNAIDRWICNYGATVTINSSGAVISRTASEAAEIFMQKLPLSLLSQLAGQVVTLSAIINGQLGSSTFAMPEDLSALIDSPEISIDGLYFDIYDVPSGGNCRARFFSAGTSQFTLTAAKLEFGPTQTLAYQDEEGNWQLLERPKFQEELAKCQAYLRTYDVVWATAPSTVSEYLQIQVVYEPMAGVPTITVGSIANFGGTEQPDLNVVSTQKSENAWWIVRFNQSISANIMLQLKNVFLEVPI